ncbi:hypothetical protein [Streptomyces sp. NPDC088757]|uniref:hypothetical protein n=1 Tax=Streptomyces sp. NPDC088757 TaxID=3365889 RepID=UPI003813D02A
MTRHEEQNRHRIRPLSGPGPGPETFYDYGRRSRAGLLTVAAGSLAVLTLTLTGALTTSRDANSPGEEEGPGTRAHRRFLADLPTYRPAVETVVASGFSRPGAPVALDTRPFTARTPHRIAYRCQGTGTVTATTFDPDGTGHRLPPVPCGPAITSLAVEEHRSITLSGDDPRAVLLWAVTTTRRTAPLVLP